MRTLRERPRRGATTRRGALGLSFSALAAAFAISSAEATNTKKTPPKPQNVIAPDAALDRLMKGNDRYVQGVSRRHDFAHEREAARSIIVAELRSAGWAARWHWDR